MGPTEVIVIGTSITTVSMTIRAYLPFLDHREDRELARRELGKTGSTDSLDGYARLRKAQHPTITLERRLSERDELASPAPPRVPEGDEAPP